MVGGLETVFKRNQYRQREKAIRRTDTEIGVILKSMNTKDCHQPSESRKSKLSNGHLATQGIKS
jgi:hypothetical protein